MILHAKTHTHKHILLHLDKHSCTYTQKRKNRNVNVFFWKILYFSGNTTEATQNTGARSFNKHQNDRKHGKNIINYTDCISMDLFELLDCFEKPKVVLKNL